MRMSDKKEKEEYRTGTQGKKTMSHPFLTALGFGAAGAGGALLGAANYFYDCAMKPMPHDPSHDSDPGERPYRAGRDWMNSHVLRRDVWITSHDGLRLHGNLIPSGDPACHRYAICVHGWHDSAESMGLYARHYYEDHGMTVLLPDLRGFGESEGNCAGMGYEDARDLIRWIRRITETDAEAVILLHGISMGAAAVLQTTGNRLPHAVRAAVADSSYTSAVEEFRAVYQKMPGSFVPSDVMIQAVRAVALVRAGYDIDKASPVSAVTHSTTPTLFIQGDSDDFVPPSMMPRLFEAASCPKACAWFAGAGHVASVVTDPQGYWKQVDHFLDRVYPFLLHQNIRPE